MGLLLFSQIKIKMGQPARPLEFTVPKEQANKSSSLLIVESVWIAANNRQKTELKSYNGSCMALTIKSGFWKRFYDANIKKSAYFDKENILFNLIYCRILIKNH